MARLFPLCHAIINKILRDHVSVEVIWGPEIRVGYAIHVTARLIIELLFFYFTYLLQTYQTNVSYFQLNHFG